MVNALYNNYNIPTPPPQHQNVDNTVNTSTTQDSSWFTDWLDDKDKVCTDNADDGKISFKEAAASFGKGLLEIVKSVVKHPIKTGLTIAAGAALTVATGGAALPVLVAAGVTLGTAQIGYGIYKASTAETDGEAKQAFETIGNGTFAVTASALSAKGALNAASKAGVSSANTAKDANIIESTVNCFKVAPKAIVQSAKNIKGNFLTVTTGTIQPNSNKLRSGQVEYMSKANEAQAYRFNPNGTEEEILANNPGVFKDANGNYCIPNKWNPNEPYIIDTSKEQMIMMYDGTSDMAVCDGGVFNGSYVDTAAFKTSGQLNYQNPVNLEYGKVVNVTKQAPGAFKIVSEGTKVQTLEGVRTVGESEVIAIDHTGSPYVTTASNILKRNIPLDTEKSISGFETIKQIVENQN